MINLTIFSEKGEEIFIHIFYNFIIIHIFFFLESLNHIFFFITLNLFIVKIIHFIFYILYYLPLTIFDFKIALPKYYTRIIIYTYTI
jgi:hypothetical protein